MKSLIILSILIFSTSAFTEVEGLISWRPNDSYPKIILPKVKGKDKETSVITYIQNIYKNSDLVKLVENSGIHISKLTAKNIEVINLKKLKFNYQSQFLLMANSFKDLKPSPSGNYNIVKSINDNGAGSYLLPVASDIGLTEVEGHEFREIIKNTFDALITVGDNEPHPRLVGQRISISYQGDLNRTRDISSLKMIHHFTESNKGVLFGICSGVSICGVDNGLSFSEGLKLKWNKSFDSWANDVKAVELEERSPSLLSFITLTQKGRFPASKSSVAAKFGNSIKLHPNILKNDVEGRALKGMINYTDSMKKLRFQNLTCGEMTSNIFGF